VLLPETDGMRLDGAWYSGNRDRLGAVYSRSARTAAGACGAASLRFHTPRDPTAYPAHRRQHEHLGRAAVLRAAHPHHGRRSGAAAPRPLRRGQRHHELPDRGPLRSPQPLATCSCTSRGIANSSTGRYSPSYVPTASTPRPAQPSPAPHYRSDPFPLYGLPQLPHCNVLLCAFGRLAALLSVTLALFGS
jgi:hypothetical protein